MPRSVALAVDFGGTKVEAALVDDAGALVPGTRFRQPTGALRSSSELAASVDAVLAATLAHVPDGVSLAGVGIGAAGPIVEDAGWVSPLNLPVWRDYPLRDQVAAAVPGLPVVLRMDGLCITLAEHWVGAAQGCQNVMGMVVSTGIGGGLILGGHTASGPTGNAGHIGHVEVAGFDDVCACGGIGCVEAIASGPKTVAWAQEHGWVGATGEDLGASYRSGNPIARAAVGRSGRPSRRRPRWSTWNWSRSAADSRASPPTCSSTSAPPSRPATSSGSSPRCASCRRRCPLRGR